MLTLFAAFAVLVAAWGLSGIVWRWIAPDDFADDDPTEYGQQPRQHWS